MSVPSTLRRLLPLALALTAAASAQAVVKLNPPTTPLYAGQPADLTLNAWQHPCDPVAVERLSDSVYVFQQGNGPCPTVGHTPVPLQPCQSATRRFLWDGRDSLSQPVPSGQYRVRMALGQVTGEAVFTVK